MSVRHIAGAALLVIAVGTAAAGQDHGQAAQAAKPAPTPAAKSAPAHGATAEAAPAAKPAAPAAPIAGNAAEIKAALQRIDQRVSQALATARAADVKTPRAVPAAGAVARVKLRWRINLAWPAEIEEQPPASAEDRIRLAWRDVMP